MSWVVVHIINIGLKGFLAVQRKNVLSEDFSVLLESPKIYAPDVFSACYGSHGSYHSTQFVLRLSPVKHRLVDSLKNKKPGERITLEEIAAYSTYIHETVHWWQFVGSTTGLIISLSYPAQTHENINSLRVLAKSTNIGKSIKSWSESGHCSDSEHGSDEVKHANIVVNNAMDYEFFRTQIYQYENTSDFFNTPYFDSMDHAFFISYQLVVGLLRTTFDPKGEFLPDVEAWNTEYTKFIQEKQADTPEVVLYPVSGLDLLEGQARLIQLQYLCLAHESSPSFAETIQGGQLDGVYGNAFKYFLQKVGCECPESILDPLVPIFLLICDISLNPSEGFPFKVSDVERFVKDADPKYRFLIMCGAAAENINELRALISEYSRDEYIAAADLLTSSWGYSHPLAIPEEVWNWYEGQESISELVQEKEGFNFKMENLAVRLLFSSFVSFNLDKYNSPEFFCWTGFHLAKSSDYLKDSELWLKHSCPFADKEDDNGVFVREVPGVEADEVLAAYNQFYASCLTFDMTRQWVLSDGPFEYDYSWLTERDDPADIEKKVKELFKGLYGVCPSEIEQRINCS